MKYKGRIVRLRDLNNNRDFHTPHFLFHVWPIMVVASFYYQPWCWQPSMPYTLKGASTCQTGLSAVMLTERHIAGVSQSHVKPNVIMVSHRYTLAGVYRWRLSRYNASALGFWLLVQAFRAKSTACLPILFSHTPGENWSYYTTSVAFMIPRLGTDHVVGKLDKQQLLIPRSFHARRHKRQRNHLQPCLPALLAASPMWDTFVGLQNAEKPVWRKKRSATAQCSFLNSRQGFGLTAGPSSFLLQLCLCVYMFYHFPYHSIGCTCLPVCCDRVFWKKVEINY